MPSLRPIAWISSARPAMPLGNLTGSGTSLPVTSSLPDFTDQQSSTIGFYHQHHNFQCLHCLCNRANSTIDVLISDILEPQIDNLVRGYHDLRSIDIAEECIPRVPAQSWEFSLTKISPSSLPTTQVIQGLERMTEEEGESERPTHHSIRTDKSKCSWQPGQHCKSRRCVHL
jgi:hypothetical protein